MGFNHINNNIPCRIIAFNNMSLKYGYAFNLWNPNLDSPTLVGTGSIYWSNIKLAYKTAYREIRIQKNKVKQDISQLRIETISGKEIIRFYVNKNGIAIF